MKQIISFADAYAKLERAEAVLIDGWLARHTIAIVENKDDNEFLHITWKDDNNVIYAVKFAEGANLTVTVEDMYLMEMIDTDGEPARFYLLAKLCLV